MDSLKKDCKKILLKIKKLSYNNKKKTAFIIGNTSKSNNKTFYFTPLREFKDLIISGAIVYNEKVALHLSRIFDGEVDFIFVDSEKKIKKSNIHIGETANIERTVKENIKFSKLFTYKGNDLTVEALDLLLSNLNIDNLKGLGSKKISILGAGNLGSKIALKLLERGADIKIYRRDLNKLKIISKALNYIKPSSTEAKLSYSKNIYNVSKNADIIIGCSDGIPIIDNKMIEQANKGLIIVDVGKGTIKNEVLKNKNISSIKIFRLDITAALYGMLQSNLYFQKFLRKKINSNYYDKYRVISGGVFGYENDIVVDDAKKPKKLYGLSDGKGDIKNIYTKKEKQILKLFSKKFLNE